MIKISFKNLGLIALAGIFVMAFVACEDNQRMRNSRYTPRYDGTMTGRTGTSRTDYSEYSAGMYSRDTGRTSILSQGGGHVPVGASSGMYARRDGGDYARRDGGVIPGAGSLGRRSGSGGKASKGAKASRNYPYIIDAKASPWSAMCSDSANSANDFDGDGICDAFEDKYKNKFAVHPEAYNGFKVSYAPFSKDENEVVLNRTDLRMMFNAREVAIAKGGWNDEATNWGTKIKREFLNDAATLPYADEVVDLGNSTFSKNKLLEKDGDFNLNKINALSKLSDSTDLMKIKEDFVACSSGWFKKPADVDATLFWIHTVDDNADDAVVMFDNENIVAFSHKEKRSLFFSKITHGIASIFSNQDTKNDLAHKITDNDYHLLEFCFYNRKGDAQAEIRYMRDMNSKTIGFEPLNALDFRVEAPSEYVGKFNSIIEESKLEHTEAPGHFTPATGDGEGKPGISKPDGDGSGDGALGNATIDPAVAVERIRKLQKQIDEDTKTFCDAFSKSLDVYIALAKKIDKTKVNDVSVADIFEGCKEDIKSDPDKVRQNAATIDEIVAQAGEVLKADDPQMQELKALRDQVKRLGAKLGDLNSALEQETNR